VIEAKSIDFSLQGPALSSSEPSALKGTIELARRLAGMGALATNCDGQLQTAGGVDHGSRRTLLSIAETVRRLVAAREAANLLEHPLSVAACTEARTAVALEDDADARDRKFLSGMKTKEDSHVYCGGLDAAISRALVFAQYAEVVCFRSQCTDLAEAACFLSEVRSCFPGKRLGFGLTPMLDGVRWNELDHRAFDLRLRQIGYDFYFVTQFGHMTFPQPPAPGAWVLMDDAVRSPTMESEVLPSLAAHRMRFPLEYHHSTGRCAGFERPRPRTASVRKTL
jgi:isocitrate lyase